MSKPNIADTKPKAVELEAGADYTFCRCGRSANQPFCDGSHIGTEFTPLPFKAKKSERAHLCMCKRTGNAPYCDGTHRTLDEKEVEQFRYEPAGGDSPPRARPTPEEPTVAAIHELARGGLERTGHHGPMAAMGVPRSLLPHWDDIQVLVGQLARRPLMDADPVGTDLVVGPNAQKPLKLDMPLFVSDMSYGALSEEAKVALARGAQMAGTGICSGEGGMLPEEQAANERSFYELASARFGYHEGLLERVQAFHFKGGQGAKTGTGGHLPGAKVTGKIAAVRCLPEGQDAISPPVFEDLRTVGDFADFSDRVREVTGGIPVGFKLSANHIEADIDFALEAGADYIILDGRGGATGAAIANSAIQAVGCVAARMCNTNNCPAGIATQKPELRARLDVQAGAERLARFLHASVELMQVAGGRQ